MCRSKFTFLLMLLISPVATAQIRDGGIDPWNLGKGDWIYFMNAATNKLGGNVPAVTNENSLMLFYKSVGIRYVIIKAATSDVLFNGSYNRPQFTSNLCNIAHANGILIFGYNRSYGSNVVGEIAISDYVFRQGADGFVWDAEAEWESSNPWIGSSGPAKAWQLCSTVRSNWPNKFLAHAPFPIISYHTSFPYKEFGYWCDTVMPQIYHFGWTGVKRSTSGAINWSDVNWFNWQNSLASLPPTNINGLTVYWTNAIKPLAPINHVYGPDAPPAASPIPDKDVMEFMDYLAADPNPQTRGGYKGVSFWRADLHGPAQWAHIKSATIGDFNGTVNNIVMDDPNVGTSGSWTSVRTFYNGSFYGGATDTNSFGTNYLMKSRGTGAAFVQFTPNIKTPGIYSVYEWHPRRTDASASVPFVISHNGIEDTIYANQQTNAGNWSFLGSFNFASGTDGYVRVLDNVPEANAVAMADGLKLVLVSAAAQPDAPSGLSARTISANQIDLSWRDNSSNETNFTVARGMTNGGPYSDIATAPANTTNYSDSSLLPSNTYYYVVRAVGAGGASTNSNQASARTLNPVPARIVSHPRSQTALQGQSATFTVSAVGTTPLAYQWRFNNGNLQGATGSAFTILSAQTVNVGEYSVIVSNAYGSMTSSNARLNLTTIGTWGDNGLGQLNVPAEVKDVVAVSAGAWHSLALQADGKVFAWGNNYDGQCSIPAGLEDVVALAGGGYHSLALTARGTVVAWGANAYGQGALPETVRSVIAIAAGKWHSLALVADGRVVAWGDDAWSQSDVPSGLSDVVAIAAGGNHSLALRADGTVAAWGENTDSHGGFSGQSDVPWDLSNVVAIAAGAYHSLALKRDGTLVAWGDNSQNQCAVSGLAGVVAIAAGGAHSVALKADGTVAAWGANWNGQCALPSSLSHSIGVAAGENHTLSFIEGAVPMARLLNPAWKMNRFTALAQTLNRRQYALEFKDSFGPTNWTALPSVSGNGALKVLADPSASGQQRFYRMIVESLNR